MPAWEELGDLIERDASPSSTRRLRAFYALEVIGSYLHDPNLVDLFNGIQRTRDDEGLDSLIATCTEAKKTLVMRRGHAQLLGAARKPALQLLSSSMRNTEDLIQICQEAAAAMKAALRGNDSELEKVGRLLADAFACKRVSLEKAIEHMQAMLGISLDNPVSPWNQSTRFQV